MNRIQDELTSERTLKKFLRESDFAFLEKLSARISAALDEKRAEHIEQENQRRQRDEKRNELLALIESEGFSAAELVSTSPAKKSAKRKAKYQYFENGVHKTWSGVGRVPVVIQQELDAGKPLESFLITTD
ncbi:H-NS family nucleoid-associated regulatory protein [Enterobacter hormaechei]|uniref:H-NS histone family protein n=1 Tax=Enterobacter hormaechei TaxID=158836 RepID=UPI0002E4DE19|nr:H-NS family nucleoid-associated regulatory protein [Enterobacter hormaechei]MBB8276542.1 H-NS histone family protein [Escherichia coli]HDT4958775.1 H-NS histone family protein [Enterobacter kobei]